MNAGQLVLPKVSSKPPPVLCPAHLISLFSLFHPSAGYRQVSPTGARGVYRGCCEGGQHPQVFARRDRHARSVGDCVSLGTGRATHEEGEARPGDGGVRLSSPVRRVSRCPRLTGGRGGPPPAGIGGR